MDGQQNAHDWQRAHIPDPVLHAAPEQQAQRRPIKRLRRWMLADTSVPHGRHAGPHGRVEHHDDRAHWLRSCV